ncbi:uncharacterized protein LOC108822504 [Raphanus sativus]|uniref:Uncharacterized protein LOC108822504 n=1 Tax=Raphanus sativus TaxID=3726 RepID=A0A6J0KVJ0_RAPSA|nr:uncharacterized protein LOC108822504 [Raphanus sativus]
MASIGASYAPVYLMQKQLKEKKMKREKVREEKAQSVAVVETSLAAGRKSNKIYPSRSSYSEQVETKSQE